MKKKTRKRSRSPSESGSHSPQSSGSTHRNSHEKKPTTEQLSYSNGSQKITDTTTITNLVIQETNNLPNPPLSQNPTPTAPIISTVTVEKQTVSTSTTIRKSTRRTVIQGAPETRISAKRRAKLQRTQTNPQ